MEGVSMIEMEVAPELLREDDATVGMVIKELCDDARVDVNLWRRDAGAAGDLQLAKIELMLTFE